MERLASSSPIVSCAGGIINARRRFARHNLSSQKTAVIAAVFNSAAGQAGMTHK
jgi:hypothetical protein